MDAATLLANFELIANAPGGVERVREMILQLAVRGKLVPFEVASADGAILLGEMRAERAKIAKMGEVRIRKTDSVSAVDELFPVPRHWTWGRLADVSRDFGQKIPNAPFTYIDVGSVDGKRGCIKENLAILQPSKAPSRARKIVKPGTVIYSTVRPYLMNIAIIECTYEPVPIASTAFGILHPLHGLSAGFLKNYLRSAEFSRFVESKMVGIYPAINDSKLFAAPIPIPPLAEQKRIVAKVDELMALCDGLEEKQKRRDSTRKSLQVSALDALATAATPAALSKAWTRAQNNWPTLTSTPESIASLREMILALAVCGKLVPQNPEDEPVSKALPPVDAQIEPYSLPLSWKWVKLGDLGKIVGGGTPRTSISDYWKGDDAISWITPADMSSQKGRYVERGRRDISRIGLENSSAKLLPVGSVVFSIRAPIGYVGVVSNPLATNQGFKSCVPHEMGMSDYIWLYLRKVAPAIDAAATGTTFREISGRKLALTPIAVPPLAEQKRIVAKVDELMALCDDLAASLSEQTAAETSLSRALSADSGSATLGRERDTGDK